MYEVKYTGRKKLRLINRYDIIEQLKEQSTDEGSGISRLILNEKIETFLMSLTQPVINLVSIVKLDFQIIIFCNLGTIQNLLIKLHKAKIKNPITDKLI